MNSTTSRKQDASTSTEDMSCEQEQPLVLASMECSFDSLQEIVQRVNFDPSGTAKHLPPELSKHVSKFLTVRRAVRDEVEAVTASSMDMAPHKLADCLVDNEESWWMSALGTMPGGRGEEYVEFRLSKIPVLRRVIAVSVRIPPLPQGPLSVREFRVDVADEVGLWRQLPGVHSVDNRTGMQRFPIGDVDAHSVRVVCLSSQISTYIGEDPDHNFERVGFYAVQFE